MDGWGRKIVVIVKDKNNLTEAEEREINKYLDHGFNVFVEEKK